MAVAKVEARETSAPLSSPEIDPEGFSYLIFRQPEFDRLCQELIEQIEASGKEYGWIIYIERGGKYPAMVVAEALGLVSHTFPMGASHYSDSGELLPEVRSYNDLSPDDVESINATGKEGLLIDEINDSTDTIKVIKRRLATEYNLRLPDPDVAVLHQKPLNMDYSASYVACELKVNDVTNNYPWVIYPWEFGPGRGYEFFQAKSRRWKKEHGKTDRECLKIFRQIGFAEEELAAAGLLGGGFDG